MRKELIEERKEFIDYLLNDCYAKVDVVNRKTLWTPMHWLAKNGDTELI